MTDRLTPLPPAPTPSAPITLSAHGKTWGRLLDGQYLEVRRGDIRVVFDLAESARRGRPVLAWVEEGEP